MDRLTGRTPVTDAAIAAAAGSPVVAVPVGTAATSEGALRELDPTAAAAFGVSSGDAGGPITRRQAMRVPGIKRGRNLVCSTLGTLPLVAVTDTGARSTTPSTSQLLRELDPRTTPAWTLAYTADRMMFHQVAWWRVLRRDENNWPVNVELLAHERVQVHPATATRLGYVTVDGVE